MGIPAAYYEVSIKKFDFQMAQDDWDLLDIDEALQEIEKAQLKHLQGIKEEMQEFTVNHLFEKDLRDIDEGWKKFEEASRKNVRFRSIIQ
jgi:hypothetical protein